MAKRIFLIALLVWLALETALWGRWLWRKNHPVDSGLRLTTTYHNDVRPHTAPDPSLGFRSRANGDVTAVLSRGDQIVAEARYRSDSHGRRLTFAPNPQASQYVLFFGCSYTFGNGVQDEETLPSQFARFRPQYHAYNYGFGGYGAQHLLLRMKEPALSSEVSEKSGHLVYVFIDDHLRRLAPPLRTFYLQQYAGLVTPQVALDSKGVKILPPESLGAWPPLVSMSRVFREWLSPNTFDEKEAIAKWVAVVAESEKYFAQHWKSSNFWVAFFPGSKAAERLKPFLREKQISYLDYSALFGEKDETMWIPGYGHPSVTGYGMTAAALARDLP